MRKKVLVAYATKLGATTEVAQTIGETITQSGYEVEINPVRNLVELSVEISGFDAVILGSAIRMGQWLPEAVKFVNDHQDHLKKIPLAIFTVHILNLGDDPKSEKGRLAYTEPIKKTLSPITEAFFAGKIDPDKLNFFERLLFKMVKSPSGDFRDWDAIRNWAAEVSALISPEVSESR
jgi:menaquinone-dependent protoporphyrinogen oxidase